MEAAMSVALTSLEEAIQRDKESPLAHLRQKFLFPKGEDGKELIYFCGNSLGLQPCGVREALNRELEQWGALGVEGHFEGKYPWYSYHEDVSALMAPVVGAKPHEVTVMNTLTTNLHLMMVSFYRPTPTRYKILIEASAFPSDRYAVASQARFHGFDPADAIVEMKPREGEDTIRVEDVETWLEEHGQDVALVMFGGVNYYTGQAFELGRITKAAHNAGAMAGFDLAHAAGNIDLSLHDDDVDFAVWCSYKYLNSGPGGIAGCFVHERFAQDSTLPRFAGWWGNDPDTRFTMPETFVPQRGAAGWQLSNAMILPMASLRVSLELFDSAGMDALRTRALELSGALLGLLQEIKTDKLRILTPLEDHRRGAQVSMKAEVGGRQIFEALQKRGVVCDYREPGVIRVAPTPMYNTLEEVWHFAQVVRKCLTLEE